MKGRLRASAGGRDRINAVPVAAGFNFHLLSRWLAALLCAYFLAAIQSWPQSNRRTAHSSLTPRSEGFFTGDYFVCAYEAVLSVVMKTVVNFRPLKASPRVCERLR